MLKGLGAPGIFCLVIMLSMQLSCQINLFLKPMSDMPTAYYCCSGSVQQILLPSERKQDITWQFLFYCLVAWRFTLSTPTPVQIKENTFNFELTLNLDSWILTINESWLTIFCVMSILASFRFRHQIQIFY